MSIERFGMPYLALLLYALCAAGTCRSADISLLELPNNGINQTVCPSSVVSLFAESFGDFGAALPGLGGSFASVLDCPVAFSSPPISFGLVGNLAFNLSRAYLPYGYYAPRHVWKSFFEKTWAEVDLYEPVSLRGGSMGFDGIIAVHST